MTDKQQRFVEEYLVDCNATQAAIRAGYSERTAQEQGSRLLSNVMVAAEIQARRAVTSKKLEISREWVLERLAAIADANVDDFMTVETEPEDRLGVHPITGEIMMLPIGQSQRSRVLNTAEFPADKKAAVSSIKQTKYGLEVKLHDKPRALELLGKYFGLFEAGAAPQPTTENNLFNAIIGSAGEDIDADEIPELEQAATAGDDVVESSGV